MERTLGVSAATASVLVMTSVALPSAWVSLSSPHPHGKREASSAEAQACLQRSSREDTGKLDSLSIHLCERDAVTNQGENICIENGKVDGSGLKKSVPGDPEWRPGVPSTATRIPPPTHPSPLPSRRSRQREGGWGAGPSQPESFLIQLLFHLVEKMKRLAQKDSVLLPLGAVGGQVRGGSRCLGLEPGPAA